MSAEVFATFVGDITDQAVLEMIQWLRDKGYNTAALNTGKMPEVFIPVILDQRSDSFVVRATFPDGYTRPSWCAQSTSVLFFKARAIRCCPAQVQKVVDSFKTKSTDTEE